MFIKLYNKMFSKKTKEDVEPDYDDDWAALVKRSLQIYFVECRIDWVRYQMVSIRAYEGEDDDGPTLTVEIMLGSPGLFIGTGGTDIDLLTIYLSQALDIPTTIKLVEYNIWK